MYCDLLVPYFLLFWAPPLPTDLRVFFTYEASIAILREEGGREEVLMAMAVGPAIYLPCE